MATLRAEIILLGPFMAGKSTIGKLLADKLSLPQVSLDTLRWDYYREIGFDDALVKEIREQAGFLAVATYWSLFNSYAIERILADHHHCVFDFGAGPIVFENNLQIAQIENALEPFANVIRLLPSPNLETSIRVLKERSKHRGPPNQGFDWCTYFVKSEANQRLAKHVVYTDGKTPEETGQEIITLVQT